MSRLLLIDSHAVIHRAFHSIPKTLTYQGRPINAMYGFYSMLYSALDLLNPKYLAFCLDAPGPTFRDKEYIAYRTQRKPADPDLKHQFPLIIDSLKQSRLTHYSLGGYEADDLLATLSQKVSQKNKITTYIITGDKDLMQLVNSKVKLFMPVKGLSQIQIYNTSAVKARLGITPSQVVDLKALMGDSSDNYPGVAGIGPKTAVNLLEEYKSLDNIYKNLDKIKPSIRAKLEKDKDNAYLSQKLAQLESSVPIKFSLKDAKITPQTINQLVEVLKTYNFKSLISRFTKKYQLTPKATIDKNQQTLF